MTVTVWLARLSVCREKVRLVSKRITFFSRACDLKSLDKFIGPASGRARDVHRLESGISSAKFEPSRPQLGDVLLTNPY